MDIESFFPGRIRVRSPWLTRQENVDQVVEKLRGYDGVRDVASNLRTGSLTIRYEIGKITLDMLKQAKEQLELLERGV